MITIFLRAIILFVVLFVVMRLMGKRQIGEMEPFELTITLVIAELACIPMADKSIPLTFGIVTIITMYLIHQLIILVSRKHVKAQQLLSGQAVLLVDNNGILYDNLVSLKMSVSDLLASLRTAGYFSLEQVKFALIETNGQLSVLKNDQTPPLKHLPISLVEEGQIVTENLKQQQVSEKQVQQILEQSQYTLCKILLMIYLGDDEFLIQAKSGKLFKTRLNAEEL